MIDYLWVSKKKSTLKKKIYFIISCLESFSSILLISADVMGKFGWLSWSKHKTSRSYSMYSDDSIVNEPI